MLFRNKELRGKAALFASALTAVTAGPMAPRFPGSEAYAQTRVGVGAEMPRIGGNYIRETDAVAGAAVLTELGDAPFAQNRVEAFQRLEVAVDALIRSEGIDVRHRETILRTLRGNSNFSSFNIRGVVPTEISSGEVVDAMMSANGAVIGQGDQMVRMNTRRVADSRTGRIGYPAERWVVDLGADGLLVFTRPEECQNWAVKRIARVEAPIAAPAVESPCMDMVITNLPPNMYALRVEVVGVHNGGPLSERDRAAIETCVRESDALGSVESINCPNCFNEEFYREQEARLRQTLPASLRGRVAFRYHPDRSNTVVRVGADGVLRLRVPRLGGDPAADGSTINEVLCFFGVGPDGRTINVRSTNLNVHASDMYNREHTEGEGLTVSALDPEVTPHLRWHEFERGRYGQELELRRDGTLRRTPRGR